MAGLETRQGFVPNHQEFGLHIRSEIARKPATQVATKIAAEANAKASYGEDKAERKRRSLKSTSPTQRVKGSYRVAKKPGNLRVGQNSRAIAVVESVIIAQPGAHTNLIEEFGNRSNRPRRTLLRAAIAVSIQEFGKFDGAGPGPEGIGSGA